MPKSESGTLNDKYGTLRHEAKPSGSKLYKSFTPLLLLVLRATFYNKHYERFLRTEFRSDRMIKYYSFEQRVRICLVAPRLVLRFDPGERSEK